MTPPQMFFSRARLNRDSASAGALSRLLLESRNSHALVWFLFADTPDRKRDFLYRETAPGSYYTLSARPPEDRHGIWHLDSKPFVPALAAGDRLGFSLRANPVVRRRPDGPGGPQKRSDVVMDLKTRIKQGADVPQAARDDPEYAAGLDWLRRQAAAAGFALPEQELPRLRVNGYRRHLVPRRDGTRMDFHSLDFEGILTVTDPAVFTTKLFDGFGPSKAYGCGLMLIRRVL